MGESCWQLVGTVARLSARDCSATIDLKQPAHGLALQLPGAAEPSSPWRILGVEFDGERSADSPFPPNAAGLDAYVRGNDLVATYDEAPSRRLRAQIYWRQLNGAQFAQDFAPHLRAAIDLIVSVNTSLLDSDPKTNVRTSIGASGEVLSIVSTDGLSASIARRGSAESTLSNSTARGFIIRPAQTGLSYLELVHPAESCRSQARNGQQGADQLPAIELEHRLFQQRLEKGVILRAWIRTAIVDRGHDEAAALAAYQQFAAAEPPLTV